MAAQRAQLTGIDRPSGDAGTRVPFAHAGIRLDLCLEHVPVGPRPAGNVRERPAAAEQRGMALSAAITPLACLAGCLAGRTRELADFRSLYVAGPALTAVGTVFALAAPLLAGPLSSVAVALAGIGTGIGPVVLILLWACLFARTETGIVETVVPPRSWRRSRARWSSPSCPPRPLP